MADIDDVLLVDVAERIASRVERDREGEIGCSRSQRVETHREGPARRDYNVERSAVNGTGMSRGRRRANRSQR